MRKGLLWGAVAAALLFGVATGRPLYARTLGDVMTSVEKGATALKDVKGTQTIKFVLGKEEITAENSFVAKTPNKFRAETSIQIPGQKKAQKVLTVCDGKSVWQEIMPPEEPKVIKMDLSAAPGMAARYQNKFMETGYGVIGADSLLKLAGADYDIKLTGMTKLDGKDMDVIEGALKKAGSQPAGAKSVSGWNLPVPAKVKYVVGVKDGFIYQIQGYDKEGKVMLEIGYKGLKFNSGVSDKNFAFKAPKGVQVFEAGDVVPGIVK